MQVFVRSLVFGICFFLVSGAALADHMNGRYFGTSRAVGYILQLSQQGRSIQATLSSPSGEIVQLNGDTDGGDYGWGNVSGAETGSFELQWSQQGITLSVSGQRSSGQMIFANRPPPQQSRTPPPEHSPPPPRQQPEQGRGETEQPGGQQDQGGTESREPASGMPNVD